MSRLRKTARERMSEWVLHCAVNQRHIRRSQPTRTAALKDACSQLLQGHAVNRIVGPNKTITSEKVSHLRANHPPSTNDQDRVLMWQLVRSSVGGSIAAVRVVAWMLLPRNE